MIEGVQYYSSKKPMFSRGIISDIGQHLNSDQFCLDCRNIRIKNGATTIRKGYKKVSEGLPGVTDKTISRLVVGDTIYANISGDFYRLDMSDDIVEFELLKSNIGINANFVRYGRYILICNGTEEVRVYDTEYDDESGAVHEPEGILPEEYIELEYIKNTSEGPILNLGSLTSSKPGIYAKFQTAEGSGDNPLFSIYASDSNKVGLVVNTHKEIATYYYKSKSKATSTIEYKSKTTYTMKGTENVMTIRSGENTESVTTDSDTASLNGTIYVFGTDTTHKSYGMKIYEMKIYDDTTLSKNLIPAKKKADGTIGLYDLVSDTFYTNTGTGDLIAGPEINYHDGEWRKCTLPEDTKISFGEVFQENIWLVGADKNSNMIYKSRAGNREKPRQVLDFIGDGSDDMTKKSKITGVASLRGTFYIFTEDSIEAVTTDSVTSVGGVYTVYSTPIAGENQLANHRAIITADDSVFFWTRGNRLKTLNYRQGYTEISVGDLTVSTPIQKFLDTLDMDQSQCFGYHNKEEYTIHFHLRQHEESFNNIVLVYEIANDNILIDNNKYYSDVVKFDGKYYAGSGINTEIYIDEYGNNDCGQEISWYRDTINYYISNPIYRKEFREIDITGEKDSLGDIQMDINVEGKNILTTVIEGQQGFPIGFASTATATEMTAGEAVEVGTTIFEKKASFRAKGKSIQIRFSGKGYGKSVLSNLIIGYRPMTDNEKTDNLQPFNGDNNY